MAQNLMRQWLSKSKDSAPKLTQAAIPAPGPSEVLIKVSATALNFSDHLMIAGTYQNTPPFPLVPGMEIAGTVAALGPNTSRFSVGQRVAARPGHGGLADYAIAKTNAAIALPDTIDDTTAAAFQITYTTAHVALARRARLAPGERLLILGAAGGAGLAAVEVGKALGAHVVAAARGADRLKAANDAGADDTIDTSLPDLYNRLAPLGLFDVVYDAIGGTFGTDAARHLRPEGRHLLIGFASGALPVLKPNHLLVKNIDTLGINISAYPNLNPEALAESTQTLLEWHANGAIRPHIGHRFPLDKADEALALLKSRKAVGKIVVTP